MSNYLNISNLCLFFIVYYEFFGLKGVVIPGLKMRFKAMNSYTQSLPLIEELPDKIPDMGQTTTESMLGGVIWGIAGEIEEFLSIYSEKYHDLKVLFWGVVQFVLNPW